MTVPAHEHLCRRLAIALPGTFDEARARFERAVPVADELGYAAARSRQEAATVAQANAPYGYMRYRRGDVDILPTELSARGRAKQYLMGNHTLAETALRHEPSAMLHTTLHTVLFCDLRGKVRLAVDQPSLPLASYDNPYLTAVGEHFDAMLARLIAGLGGCVPEHLRSALVDHYGLPPGQGFQPRTRPRRTNSAESSEVTV
ncbi:hypothetical protein [Mycolicibacterium smegmatis]|uniref:hypothetical protein n=1 Tax=Mycolicibacterium smegmatis TaxID=1772 RepID=UPI001303DF29|nr:hypothetical protein [Mycolicibacterium smegmatis]